MEETWIGLAVAVPKGALWPSGCAHVSAFADFPQLLVRPRPLYERGVRAGIYVKIRPEPKDIPLRTLLKTSFGPSQS